MYCRDDSLPRSDRNMRGTFLQGKLERYGGGGGICQDSADVPVGIHRSEILFKIQGSTANKENAQLDSWTVGEGVGCRRWRLAPYPNRPCSAARVTSGNGGGSTRASAVTSSFHGVGGMSLSSYRLCFWVDRVAHRHSKRPAGLSLTPFDVVSGPSADKHDSRGKIDFPQTFRRASFPHAPWADQDALVIIIILCPCGNRFPCPALPCQTANQSLFGSVRIAKIITTTFSRWRRGGGFAKNGFR